MNGRLRTNLDASWLSRTSRPPQLRIRDLRHSSPPPHAPRGYSSQYLSYERPSQGRPIGQTSPYDREVSYTGPGSDGPAGQDGDPIPAELSLRAVQGHTVQGRSTKGALAMVDLPYLDPVPGRLRRTLRSWLPKASERCPLQRYTALRVFYRSHLHLPPASGEMHALEASHAVFRHQMPST
jgi:hypothetical protein